MKLREDDIPDVREESFRYSGPKPQTKESAIVSLADMVESASRSLEKPTPQKIESVVNELIEERIVDRQLDECDLTLAELKVIAERFRFTLMMMLHRIPPLPRSSRVFASVASFSIGNSARSAPRSSNTAKSSLSSTTGQPSRP